MDDLEVGGYSRKGQGMEQAIDCIYWGIFFDDEEVLPGLRQAGRCWNGPRQHGRFGSTGEGAGR